MDNDNARPTLTDMKMSRGAAGSLAVTVTVSYPDEPAAVLTFHGSAYGAPGPVVMVTPAGVQTFVTDPGRCGETFGTAWVTRFFE